MISLQLFDVVYREETLLNVIRSVTRNGRSIVFTAVLALILVYMFSIIGYIFFQDDFLVPVDDEVVRAINQETEEVVRPHIMSCAEDLGGYCNAPAGADGSGGGADDGEEKKERACDSLIMCIVTTLNQGLRNGGGIGDILRAPSSQVSESNVVVSGSEDDVLLLDRNRCLWPELFTISCSSSW